MKTNRFFLSLACAAMTIFLCGCSTVQGSGDAANQADRATLWTSPATSSEVDLQRRQAAASSAFLSRLSELETANPHPQDPDHHRAYESAARHMLARASALLGDRGAAVSTDPTPEAAAILRADVRRVESEYARQALALQREVVRSARGPSAEGGPADAAAFDLGLLLTLRNPMISVPGNTLRGTNFAGASPVVKGAAEPSTPQVEGSGNAAYDEYMKRKGFTSHPAYAPPPK